LQAAVEGGNINVIRLLLEAQANINASTADYPVTALELAVQNSRSDIVRLLLTNDARVNPALGGQSHETTALGEA
jgi:ankyrin repeat protein